MSLHDVFFSSYEKNPAGREKGTVSIIVRERNSEFAFNYQKGDNGAWVMKRNGKEFLAYDTVADMESIYPDSESKRILASFFHDFLHQEESTKNYPTTFSDYIHIRKLLLAL